jgi:hypothetical protein
MERPRRRDQVRKGRQTVAAGMAIPGDERRGLSRYTARAALTATDPACTLHGVSRSLPRLFVVVMSLLAIVSHVCVLPTHAHAESIPAAVDHHETADDHDPGESVHAASCEAAVSTCGHVPVPVSATVDRLPHSRAANLPLCAVTADAVLRSESPPLFLLHSSLLI